jgi:hypothetical protein
MESIGYQTMLERNLLPFIASKYPDGHRFWQDNDPKHIRNFTLLYFNQFPNIHQIKLQIAYNYNVI